MTRSQRLAPLLLLALAAASGSALQAQPARRVRDLNTTPEPGSHSNAFPRSLRMAGSRALFLTGVPSINGEPARNVRLWAASGDSTEVLASFCVQFCAFPPDFVGGTADVQYFFADDEVDSSYSGVLWRTDGTRAGTQRIWPASGSGGFNTSTALFQGRLAFGGCDSGGCGLWLSDGTAAGTRRVSSSTPFDLVESGGRLSFLGWDGHAGLFVSDGTAAGTRKLRRLADDGYPWLLTAAGPRLFFMTGEYSGELWTSDGTREGTQWVQTFPESSHDFVPRNTSFLVPRGERIYFLSIGLWTTDGRGRGRNRAQRLNRAVVRARSPHDLAFLPDGRVVHVEGDGITGDRIWIAGKAPEETAILSGCPGGCPVAADPEVFATGDGRILFRGADPAHGAELWVTDGTGAGTRLLADLCPGPCDGDPGGFRQEGGRVFFAGRAGAGFALYTTDLGAAGAVPLAPLDEASAADPEVTGLPGRYYFAALDSALGLQLWRSDGTPGGTRPISAIDPPAPSSDPQGLASLDGRLLFAANDGRERGLWTADPAGLDAAPLLAPGALGPGGAASGTTVAGLYAYFFNAAGGTAPGGGEATPELWRSDGTTAGTVRLAAFPGGQLSLPLAVAGRYFFLVAAPPGERPRFTLWESDGTPSGTKPRAVLPDDALRVPQARVAGSEIYLVVRREVEHQLFRSDGTQEGTRPVFTFACEFCLDEAEDIGMAQAYGTTWFTTWLYTPGNLNELSLFRTDGTAAGTVQVLPDHKLPEERRVQPSLPLAVLGSDLVYLAYAPALRPNAYRPFGLFRGATPPEPIRALAYYGDNVLQPTVVRDAGRPGRELLFFRGAEVQRGIELWVSDGTAAGTHRVKDIQPGPNSGDPQELTAASGRLYFTAFDAEHGRELWQSDGTEEGTFPVQDIAPGSASSTPQHLLEASGRLYFSADDGQTGRELWSLPLGKSGAPEIP